MKQLEADIKNKIYKNIYVLYGPQSYNRKRYEKALVSLFVVKGDTMNLTYYYGKKIDSRLTNITMEQEKFRGQAFLFNFVLCLYGRNRA